MFLTFLHIRTDSPHICILSNTEGYINRGGIMYIQYTMYLEHTERYLQVMYIIEQVHELWILTEWYSPVSFWHFPVSYSFPVLVFLRFTWCDISEVSGGPHECLCNPSQLHYRVHFPNCQVIIVRMRPHIWWRRYPSSPPFLVFCAKMHLIGNCHTSSLSTVPEAINNLDTKFCN